MDTQNQTTTVEQLLKTELEIFQARLQARELKNQIETLQVKRRELIEELANTDLLNLLESYQTR